MVLSPIDNSCRTNPAYKNLAIVLLAIHYKVVFGYEKHDSYLERVCTNFQYLN